ncbi:MFS transporter [Cryobacterium sp. Y57]|uniref:MFS transporter n=1 Tax=Cryobacterium sp. Y57 TaxID=2048287 RepID=UPI000CE4C6CB|nr:MFS transporter [Cryobacterium sp. Y57]
MSIPVLTRSSRIRAIAGASAGNAIEFFDFAIYGFLAVYIGQNFFPSGNPTTELLSSFAVFGLAFFARPLGGLVFGSLADKIGRKRVLIIVLTLMSGSSVLVGVLPNYETIGIAAPILLVFLRIIQGFSAGGEYGSGSTFLLESSAPGHRGFGVSWLTVGTTVGVLLGIIVVTALTAIMGAEAMSAWGWRIPFLFAAPLALIALYIRKKLEDTPEFKVLAAKGDIAKAPVRDAFKMKRNMLIIFGIGAFHATAFYTVFTYMPTYINTVNGFGPELSLWSTLLTGLVVAVVLPTVASLSDRVGRRAVLLAGGICFGVLVLPAFWLITLGNPVLAVLMQVLMGALMATSLAASAVTMPELFPTKIRTTGMSIGYSIPAALFGGGAPFIATLLIAQTGITVAPAFFLIVTAAIGVTAAAFLKPTDLFDDTYLESLAKAERNSAPILR